ncbi:hypothetical protein OHA61_34070 [Streptomyces sp. NBC_00885]|uniref:hypothetical protein n=1 Tax=Streptomyces sp. NBC_00885 TaxID=2975857 RepID=UPI003866AA3B|nr:hypothetical protein OHA61_34070 [Streptomyces sp. NBC_00885]
MQSQDTVTCDVCGKTLNVDDALFGAKFKPNAPKNKATKLMLKRSGGRYNWLATACNEQELALYDELLKLGTPERRC